MRLLFLDSLRGLAALQVLIFHVNNALLGDNEFIARVFINGVSPVSFFFVLSGFVLTFPFIKGNRNINIFQFSVKRIFRIYPLYIVLIFLLGLVYNYDIKFMIKESSLFFSQNKIIFPSWTLTIELIGSVYIIIFTFFLLRKKILVCSVLILSIPFFTYFETHLYLVNFLLGLLLTVLYVNKTKLINFSLFIISIIGYFFIGIINIEVLSLVENINSTSSNLFYFAQICEPFLYLISGLFSFYILHFIINKSSYFKWLENRGIQYLGKVSFGLYLVHFPVVFFFTPYLTDINGVTNSYILTYIFILLIVFIISLTGSSILYKYVELPFIKASKKLFKKEVESI